MNLIKNIFIIFIVSIFTLKACDITFGFLKDKFLDDSSLSKEGIRSIQLREHSPDQSAIVRPTDHYMNEVENLNQINYEVSIDSNGFIASGNPKNEDPELKILFLGGSTTETLYVQQLNRFPSIVERNLRQNLNKEVEVFNSGVSGNNSMNSLLLMIGKGIPLNLNYSILMHNFNDFSLLSKTGSYWIAPKGRSILLDKTQQSNQILQNSFKRKIFQFIKQSKDLLAPNLYSYLRPRILTNISYSTDEFAAFRGENFSNLNVESYKNQFYSSLLSFIHISRAWNIEPILMTQANRVDLDQPYFQEWFHRNNKSNMSIDQFVDSYNIFNQLIREVSITENVELIDLEKIVPKNNKFIYDTAHLNDAGSQLVGKVISDFLILKETNQD